MSRTPTARPFCETQLPYPWGVAVLVAPLISSLLSPSPFCVIERRKDNGVTP